MHHFKVTNAQNSEDVEMLAGRPGQCLGVTPVNSGESQQLQDAGVGISDFHARDSIGENIPTQSQFAVTTRQASLRSPVSSSPAALAPRLRRQTGRCGGETHVQCALLKY